MVADLFRDVPSLDEELPEEGVEDDGSTEPEDETPDPSASASKDGAQDDKDDDGPVSRAKYVEDMAGLQRMIGELKTSVGRAQSLARQMSNANDNTEVMTQLRQQNLAVADLFATLVDGIDESALDPSLRVRVKEARGEILEAERKAEMMDEIRKELGITPGTMREQEALSEQQDKANALAEDIEDQIVAAGLDPDDATLFPWPEWVRLFKAAEASGNDGARTVRRAAIKAIADAQNTDQADDRRESRRAAAGKTPRGSTPAVTKDPLTTGDLDARIKALRALTRS